jgi:DNA-binding MarR family transcriptional regulator
MIASMQAKSTRSDALAARLLGAFHPIIKGSQAAVMTASIDFDLTLSQLRMLFILEHEGNALAVNDLAERISLSIAATGRALDALYRAELVSRREDDNDRRIKRIALTERGHQALEKIGAARRQATEKFVRGLNAVERAALEGAVDTLCALTAVHFPTHGAATACAVVSPPAPRKSKRER